MVRQGVCWLLVAGALLGGAASVGASTPQRSARLAFVTDWSGVDQIYVVDPAGKARSGQVTFGRGGACVVQTSCRMEWSVSPDGRHVLFSRTGAALHPSPFPTAVFVGDIDGSHTRRVDTTGIGQPLLPTWSPDARQIAWMDSHGIHVERVDGSHRHLLIQFPVKSFSWSRDGKSYAYLTNNGDLFVRAHGRTRTLASAVQDFSWSPNGKWIATTHFVPAGGPGGGWSIVHPDGRGLRHVDGTPEVGAPQWSPDSRWLTLVPLEGPLQVYDLRRGRVDTVAALHRGSPTLAWSPVHDRLAFTDSGGIELADLDRGTLTTLAPEQRTDSQYGSPLRWSPDGRQLAYVESSSLKVVDLSGAIRVVWTAAGSLGGAMNGFSWVELPAATRLKPPAVRSLGTVAPDSLQALWPVDELAADGDKVAFTSCGHVFVWSPARQTVEQGDPVASLTPACTSDEYGYFVTSYLYDLAVAGDRVAEALHGGSTSTYWTVSEQTLADHTAHSVDSGAGLAGGPQNPGIGQLTGAGSLLVYSRWQESYQRPVGRLDYPVISQALERIEPDGTTTSLHVEPGPFITGDVDEDRVALYGTEAVLVVDANGRQLLSLPVKALGVQLDGNDLVVLTQGRLHVYDATSGVERASWPLPDVPTGRTPGDDKLTTHNADTARLELEDVAHGEALYTVGGQIHLLRLADGTDTVVAAGSLACFVDAGVVYAAGDTLHLVPFTSRVSAS